MTNFIRTGVLLKSENVFFAVPENGEIITASTS